MFVGHNVPCPLLQSHREESGVSWLDEALKEGPSGLSVNRGDGRIGTAWASQARAPPGGAEKCLPGFRERKSRAGESGSLRRPLESAEEK